MDIASIVGIIIGFLAIGGSLALESNSFLVLFQPVAAIVVLGGTFGASLLNFSFEQVKSSFRALKYVFKEEREDIDEVAAQLIELANISREHGLLQLQSVVESINNDFLRRGVQLALDINNPQLLRDILENEISLEHEDELSNIKIFEAMGGYAPTFGVIGAVLGLIDVMLNLQDPIQLGRGVASAFVATVYGVGFANLFFIPIAGKLQIRLRAKNMLKEMIIQGIISIHLGENPVIIEEKLVSFLNYTKRETDLQTV